jgi:diguanylate cyclase
MFHAVRGHFAALISGQEVKPQPGQEDMPTFGSARRLVREVLLRETCDFLLQNDLDLSATNFEFAREIASGHNVKLVNALQEYLATGVRLTNASVQELIAKITPAKMTPAELMEMLTAVESQASNLLGLANRTKGDVGNYGSALRMEAASLATDSGAGVVKRLVDLTLSMAERTQTLEAEMHESHKQAKRLKARLEKARFAADHDALTGLPNRRAFERRYAEALTYARNHNSGLTVAFCDVDHFKVINDTHGHATGDRVLCFIADLLMRVSGSQCHVARHGGEEFVLLFENMDTAKAFDIVDDARRALGSRKLASKDTSAPIDTITFSAGVADVLAFNSPSDALRAADEALYRAKSEGRNRVLLASQALSAMSNTEHSGENLPMA